MANEIYYSIIIPSANHPNLLFRCIIALLNARKPEKKFEILVIDNSSDDQLMSENYKIAKQNEGLGVRYLSMPPLGLMAARHFGVENAKGHIICLLDDDAFVSESWFEGVERTFQNRNVVLATGPLIPEYEESPPYWLNMLWEKCEYGRYLGYLGLLDFGNEGKWIPAEFVWGGNCLIIKDIFLKVKGSHPDYLPSPWTSYQGDGECGLTVKVAALGHKGYYTPKCIAKHFVPKSRMTLDYLCKRAFFVGLHSSFTHIRREHGMGPQYGVPIIIKKSIYRRLRSLVGKVICPFRPTNTSAKIDSEEIRHIRHYLCKCFIDGWNYHQNEVKINPKLLEYVLRPHYMGENAKIP